MGKNVKEEMINDILRMDSEYFKKYPKGKAGSLKKFDDFTNAVTKKKKFPKHIDWDEEYYSQFE